MVLAYGGRSVSVGRPGLPVQAPLGKHLLGVPLAHMADGSVPLGRLVAGLRYPRSLVVKPCFALGNAAIRHN